MIGGHDHRLLSTNYRINKPDFNRLLECLQNSDDCVRASAFHSCLASVKLEMVQESKAISPDDFDPDTMTLKNSIVYALPPSEKEAEAPTEHTHSVIAEEALDIGDLEAHSAILCFGDSLTAGLTQRGSALCPYSASLKQQLSDHGGCRRAVIDARVCGETTKEMCKRMRELLQQYGEKIAMVLILRGTNDLGDDDLTPRLTIGNIQQLHSMVHAYGARTAVLTVPDCTEHSTDLVPRPYEQELDEINTALRNFALTSDSMFLVDVAKSLPQDEAHMTLWERDGVYLSAKGYEELGNLMAEAIHAELQTT
jgi:lysophospholipase L1-like esterase